MTQSLSSSFVLRATILLLIVASGKLCCQETFQKVLSSDSIEEATCVSELSDDSYFVGGYTNKQGPTFWNAFLMKVDTFGNVQWSFEFGYPNEDDWLSSVCATSDGGVVCALTYYPSSNIYSTVIKFDANGNWMWSRTFENVPNACDIIEVNDTCLLMSFMGWNGFGILKMDRNGNFLWQSAFAASMNIIIDEVKFVETFDHGFILGSTLDAIDMIFVRLDSAGNLLWYKRLGNSPFDNCYDIIETGDSCHLILGARAPAPYSRPFLIKMDDSSNIVWSSAYSSTVNGNEYIPTGLTLDPSGNIYFTAVTLIPPSINKIGVFKLDSNGIPIWGRRIGGVTNDWPGDLLYARDRLFTVGCSKSYGSQSGFCNIYLMMTDSLGVTGCNEVPLTLNTYPIQFNSDTTTLFPDPGVIVSTFIYYPTYYGGFNEQILCATNIEESGSEQINFTVNPRPVTIGSIVEVNGLDGCVAHFELYDARGIRLYHDEIFSTVFLFPVAGLPAGIYIAQVTTSCGDVVVQKLIVE